MFTMCTIAHSSTSLAITKSYSVSGCFCRYLQPCIASSSGSSQNHVKKKPFEFLQRALHQEMNVFTLEEELHQLHAPHHCCLSNRPQLRKQNCQTHPSI